MHNSQQNIGHAFKQALTSESFSVIAEIKRRSPSAGNLYTKEDIASLARQYHKGGAACLSILTNGPFFDGSPADLKQAREITGLPVLRKDFLTSLEDIYETQAMGADALLLIAADVAPDMLRPLHELSFSLGLDVLTEIRNMAELEAAIAAGAYMIAVNQRSNPKTSRFTVDYNKAVKMSRLFAEFNNDVVKVAASGIGVEGGTRIADLATAGYDAALIGEALITDANPTARLQSLLSDARQATRTDCGL